MLRGINVIEQERFLEEHTGRIVKRGEFTDMVCHYKIIGKDKVKLSNGKILSFEQILTSKIV